MIIGCFITNIIFYKYGVSYLRYFAIPICFMVNSLSLLLIWICFERFPQLSTASCAGRFLSFVGRRSLDVYFLHYFFIPFNLGLIGEFCVELNSTVLSYFIATFISLIITILSLGLGQIIRLSPFTAKHLLGSTSGINKSSSSNDSKSYLN